MYSEEEIASAISAGIITETTAAALREHVAQLRATPAVDEEHFRLLSGFNDIFVVIACTLLLLSVNWIGEAIAPWLGALAVAVVAWPLAEFFTIKRRMALPSIVLLLAFVGGVYFAAYSISGKAAGAAGVAAAIAAWLHWQRFKVPITVAAGALAVVSSLVLMLMTTSPELMRFIKLVSFVAGVAVFVMALRWDAADTLRQTGKSDVAFWLHLLAAPLMVHPMFTTLGVFSGYIGWGQALAVVVLYIVIGLISLAIDRRALMVSALVYVLYAFSSLLKLYGVVSLGFAMTALVIGAALLLLSAFWHPCREFVLRRLSATTRQKLAPLR
ncbi:MAG: hypothetical protein WC426_07170 [Sulfuriferula sp.]